MPNTQLSKPTHTKALKNSGLACSNIWLCVNISLLIACFFSTDDLFGHFSSVSVNSHKINIKDSEKSANSCLSYPVTCAQRKQKNVQKATLSHQLLKVKWMRVCLYARVFSMSCQCTFKTIKTLHSTDNHSDLTKKSDRVTAFAILMCVCLLQLWRTTLLSLVLHNLEKV